MSPRRFHVGGRIWEADVDWLPVSSNRVSAIAYDEEDQAILVEFPNGKRWWYGACDPDTWSRFSDPATSKGQFIHAELNAHPNGRYDG